MTLLIKESKFNSTTVKDISLTTTSFITIIIAVLLFDRFGYRKIIFEKKLELVLELLEKIKAIRIQVTYESTQKHSAGIVNISKKKINHLKTLLNPESFVVFSLDEMYSHFQEMSLLRTNPFMPKEIAKNLDFLNVTSLTKVKGNSIYENEHIKLSINRNPKNLSSLEDWCKTDEDISFNTFTNNYLICLLSI